MGEEQLLQLANEFIKTPKGKSLLKESLNVKDIINRIEELANQYNIDLSTIKSANIKDVNFSLDSNLTKEQRREKRKLKKLSSKQRLQERLDQEGITGIDQEQKIKAEIALLKAKLESETPTLEEFNIIGRIIDINTNTPLKGAKVTLGVNIDAEDIIEQSTIENLGINPDLIKTNINVNPNDFIYVPVLTQKSAKTDSKGNFTIKIKIPIIPKNQKCLLNIALLYTKSNYIPGTQLILNGDKTIKTNLSVSKLINIQQSAKDASQEINDKIDEAQALVKNIALNPFELAISAKKVSIANLVEVLKTKLVPLTISLLISFGISKLTQSNRKTCPSPEALNDVVRTRNRVVRQLNQIFKNITLNTSLAVAFAALSVVLKGVRLNLDNLSTPQSIGTFPAKDFGGLIYSLPYSFTAKLQRLDDLLEKLESQNKSLNKATLTSLIFLITGIIAVVVLLKEIDKMTQECAEENGTSDLKLTALNQELLNLSEEEAEDGNPLIKNINGFNLSVETDNKNPVGTLKRRFAVAKDSRGITLLKGEPSFSSSDQILIDELVFYIQQNDLKAF